MTTWWLVIDDYWLSSHGKCGWHGCPQADGVGKRESSEFKRNLNGGPQADEVRKQVSINDDWLLIIDDWWLIVDCLHTDDTDGHGCPQADFVGERESSEINRELKEMGPQADEVRIQVSINDDWWLIVDCLNTENAEDTEVRRRTLWGNVNHRELNGFKRRSASGRGARTGIIRI